MNVPLQSGAAPEIVTQESLLFGAAERIGRIRQGRLAVHLYLSRLRAQNRQEGHIRIALRMLEPMINGYRGQMFLLANSDIVFMLKEPNLTDVENMIFKLRALFSKDPLTFADSGDGRDNFCDWYDLGGGDYDAFLAMAREAMDSVRQKNRAQQQKSEPKPLDVKTLGGILERLETVDATGMIRRQAAIEVKDSARVEVLFQEFFVAMAELQKALSPDVALLGNRWLFQHLSQALDLRVLAALRENDLRRRPNRYSLNLNLSTVLSDAFADFQRSERIGSAVLVELQLLDILADSRGFYAARRRLREFGNQLAIDGLNELTLQFLDVTEFDADLYKVNWSPEMNDTEHGGIVARAMQPLDRNKLLLARCDSEAAIQWGLARGIQRFQGRYVDTMLAAYTMAECSKASACTLAQCVNRHGVIAGDLRGECGNLDMLDSSPVMRAPKRKPAPAPATGARK